MLRPLRQLPALDALLAVGLAVASALLQQGVEGGPEPWIGVVAAVWSLPIALRTVAPLAMAAGWSLAGVLYAALPVADTSLASFITLLVVTFSAGVHLAGRRLVTAVALMLVSTYAVQLLTAQRPGGDTRFGDVFVSPLVLMLPVLGGMLLRRSRWQTNELRRLTAALAAEREAHARDAAGAERNRIARELHDVISHSVSVMVVQAGAAAARLPEGSPARPSVDAVRRTGKEAMAELRRQLGLLRDGPSELPPPIPGVEDLIGLIGESGAILEGHADRLADLSPGAALTAYRVVQEALTNARRHAAGAAVRVRLDLVEDRLDIEIVNDPSGCPPSQDSPGYGLAGMRERVAAYAGQLEAGRTADGGWQVRVRLPVHGVA